MVKDKQGLHLEEDQRRVLGEILKQKIGSAREIAQAINKSTGERARSVQNKPVIKSQMWFFLARGEKTKDRPLSPSIAKAMYELCDRAPELDFLREYSELCDIEVDVGLAPRIVRKGFDTLAEAKRYGIDILYRTMRGLLDKAYQSQKSEEQRKEFLGELEGLLKRFPK